MAVNISWSEHLTSTLSVKKDQFFSGDQYFSPTNDFTKLKLTPTKNFYQLLFLLNKNQITKIIKKLSDLLYHNLVERRWVENGREAAIVIEDHGVSPC